VALTPSACFCKICPDVSPVLATNLHVSWTAPKTASSGRLPVMVSVPLWPTLNVRNTMTTADVRKKRVPCNGPWVSKCAAVCCKMTRKYSAGRMGTCVSSAAADPGRDGAVRDPPGASPSVRRLGGGSTGTLPPSRPGWRRYITRSLGFGSRGQTSVHSTADDPSAAEPRGRSADSGIGMPCANRSGSHRV
jgi:hypothetical protein